MQISRLQLITILTAAGMTACGGPEGAAEEAQGEAIITPPRASLPPLPCAVLGSCRISREEGEAAPIQAHLGRGWNEVSDTDTPSYFSCLEPFGQSTVRLTNPIITSSFELVSSSITLNDTLDLDARVSGAVPGVPVSGSLGGSLLQKATAHQDSINLLVRTTVQYAPQRITTTPRVSASALARFDGAGPRAFRDLCGDRFVDQVTPGGEYVAIIQISSADSTAQRTMKARLSAAIGASASGGEAVAAAVEEANIPLELDVGGTADTTVESAQFSVRIDTLKRGGNTRVNATTIREVIQEFANFPASIQTVDDTAVMGVHLARYTAIPNFGTRRPFSVSDASSAVSLVLAPRYVHYLDVYNQLNFALENQANDMYFPFDAVAVADLRDQAAENLLAVEAAVDTCASGNGCTVADAQLAFPTNFAPSASLPKRKQFYKVLAKALMDATSEAGASSSFTADANLGGSCHIDQDTTPPMPAAGHVRVWTGRGLSGTTCRYSLMRGARLTGLWDVHSIDQNIPVSNNQRITHSPEKSDLRFGIVQTSPLASFAPDTTAVIHHFILVGPEGDPSREPWRAAISVN